MSEGNTSLILFDERAAHVFDLDVAVWICGQDVSPFLEGAVTVARVGRDGWNTASFQLNNSWDRFVITPENLYGEWLIDPTGLADERVKYNLFCWKDGRVDPMPEPPVYGGPISIEGVNTGYTFMPDRIDSIRAERNPSDPVTGACRWEFQPYVSVFHEHDQVRIWVKEPFSPPDYPLWIPLFAGFLRSRSVPDDYISGAASISLSAEDIRSPMQRMRTQMNNVAFDTMMGAKDSSGATIKTLKNGYKEIFWETGFFADMTKPTAFGHPFVNVSLSETIKLLICGGIRPRTTIEGLDPAQLTTVANVKVHQDVAKDLSALLEAANRAGMKLGVYCGYRSPMTQIRLWMEGKKKYVDSKQTDAEKKEGWRILREQLGDDPRTNVKSPRGHLAGLSVDFNIEGYSLNVPTETTAGASEQRTTIGNYYQTIRSTPTYRWLKANAARFSFQETTSEPWHYTWQGKLSQPIATVSLPMSSSGDFLTSGMSEADFLTPVDTLAPGLQDLLVLGAAPGSATAKIGSLNLTTQELDQLSRTLSTANAQPTAQQAATDKALQTLQLIQQKELDSAYASYRQTQSAARVKDAPDAGAPTEKDETDEALDTIRGVGQMTFGGLLYLPDNKQSRATLLERWHRMVTYGADPQYKRKARSPMQWHGSRPVTTEEMRVIGNASHSTGKWSVDKQALWMLFGSEKSDIQSLVEYSANYQEDDDVQWDNRLAILQDFLGKVDYQLQVNGMGDMFVEFPMYDMLPSDFGAAQPVFEFDGHLVSATSDEEAQGAPCGFVVTGRAASSLAQEDTIQQGAEYQAPRYFCFLPILAMRYGPQIEELQYTWITNPDTLKRLALIELQKRLGDINTFSLEGAFRPWLTLNRPIHHVPRDRMVWCQGCTFTLTLKQTPSTSLDVSYPRFPDPTKPGVYRHATTGGRYLPIVFHEGYASGGPSGPAHPESTAVVLGSIQLPTYRPRVHSANGQDVAGIARVIEAYCVTRDEPDLAKAIGWTVVNRMIIGGVYGSSIAAVIRQYALRRAPSPEALDLAVVIAQEHESYQITADPTLGSTYFLIAPQRIEARIRVGGVTYQQVDTSIPQTKAVFYKPVIK